MKAIQIRNTYWSTNGNGSAEPLFTAGQVLPADDEGALRQLALNNADTIDVPEDADKAAQAAEAARAAADKAVAKAEAATQAAEAAAAVAAATQADPQ